MLDQPRNRVYISNAGYNRIEVFDTVNRVFLAPITVGQLPGKMGLSTDGNTLLRRQHRRRADRHRGPHYPDR